MISNLQKQMVAPASYDVRYIEGPMSLTKFKLLDENKNPIKSAYIFGEQHEDKDKIEGSCPQQKRKRDWSILSF